MTVPSTTAIEAAMFNKGIIVLQPKIVENDRYRNDLMIKGQHFLQQSLDLNGSPSDRIYRLIQSLL